MSLAAATVTSSGGRGSLAGSGVAAGASSVTSLAELDPQQLVAHAHVIAVLDQRRGGDAHERAVRAAEVGDLRLLAVPGHGSVTTRHERIVTEHDVALLAPEDDLLTGEV